MHGIKETGNSARIVCTTIHAVFLATAAWILIGNGDKLIAGLIGIEVQTDLNLYRALTLLGFGIVLFFRMLLVHFYLLKRKFGWEELGGVLTALAVYQIGFPLLAIGANQALGVFGYLGIGLFILGSYVNTGSELQRKRFKDDPCNKGKLYTGGLFKYARHINYFGDTLWVTGWAILTLNWWSALIPAALTAGFIFFFIPPLTAYLNDRYKEQFNNWRKKTKTLIPFIY